MPPPSSSSSSSSTSSSTTPPLSPSQQNQSNLFFTVAQRPTTPTHLKYFVPSNTFNATHLLSHSPPPPSPLPRDSTVEEISLSMASIFERDVEHFEATLTAQEATQLAVPPVLDEAIQVLATVPPEDIVVDRVPLQVHYFNPLSLDSTPSSPLYQPTSSVQPPVPTNSNQFPLYQPSSISSSNSAIHQPTKSIPSYPFPTSSESIQPISINTSSHHPGYRASPSPPIARFHRQPLSCTSDTASISDPSSPRSLSPTPSFMLSRSMFTQLADHEPTSTIKTHTIQPLSELSIKPSRFIPSSPAQLNTDNTPPLRQRKTCISFMSYVDVLNSERAILDPPDSPAPLSSALNALRLARKSTSSLVKRASSIFSHPPRRRGISTITRNNNKNIGSDSIDKRWVDRSRCSSNNSNYHSCPTHQPTIGENDQSFPLSSFQTDGAEVLIDSAGR